MENISTAFEWFGYSGVIWWIIGLSSWEMPVDQVLTSLGFSLVFRSFGVQKVSPVRGIPPPSAATQPGAALGSLCQWCFLASWQEQLMGRGSWRSNQRQVTTLQTHGTHFAVSPVARRGRKLLLGWR